MNKDLIGGLVLLAIAGVYYWSIGSIAQSSLSDEVGAAGLPTMLAIALGVIAVLLVLRGLVATWRLRTVAGEAEEDGEETASLPRAVGFLLFGVAYIVLLPFVGYVLAIALLIAGVALYEGAARDWKVPVVALGGAVFFWAMFVALLGVRQPAGVLFGGLF